MKFFKSRKLPKNDEIESQLADDLVQNNGGNTEIEDLNTQNEDSVQTAVLDDDFQQDNISSDEVVLVNEPIVLDDEYFATKDDAITDNTQNQAESGQSSFGEDTQQGNTDIDLNDINESTETEPSADAESKDSKAEIEVLNGDDTHKDIQSDSKPNSIGENEADNSVQAENLEQTDSNTTNDAANEEDMTSGDNKQENSKNNEQSDDVAENDKPKTDKKKKKVRNILIAVAVAIVILAVSIVTPILVLNKGKIFVNEAGDLLKTKGDIYVINEDITYSGDLTLSKNINLKGNHLRVDGVLTLDLSQPTMNVGTLKKKVYTAEGNISATKIVIIGVGAVTIANNVTVGEMEINAKKVKFSSNITVQNSLIINADNKGDEGINFAGNVEFGTDSKGVTIEKSKVNFEQGVMADVSAIDSIVKVGVMVGNVTMDDKSELRCSAKVIKDFATQEPGIVKGGALVYMSEESSADIIDGAKLYWTSQSNKNIREEKNIGETRYTITLQTPSYGNVFVVGEKIYLKLDVVQSAERYSIKVNQDAEIIINVTGEDKENNIMTTDILSEKLSKVGKHTITIVAMGAEGEGEFVKNSEPIKLQYEHNMELKAPSNIKVYKDANNDYILTFDAVIFADYYEVIFDTVKLQSIPFDEGLTAEGKIIVNLSKKDVLNNKFSVGKHIVSIVAKSNNPNIKPSKSDFTTFKITQKQAAVTLTVDSNAGMLNWNSTPNALTYTVYIKRNNKFEVLAVVKTNNYRITEVGEYAVVVDGIANGYYEESDYSNTVMFVK